MHADTGSSFEFVSVVHVDPAPNSENDRRGFHSVIVKTTSASTSTRQNGHGTSRGRATDTTVTNDTTSTTTRRIAWAAAIRGELVGIDMTDLANPKVVYNKQDPGPSAHLYNSRTLMWLPGFDSSVCGAHFDT